VRLKREIQPAFASSTDKISAITARIYKVEAPEEYICKGKIIRVQSTRDLLGYQEY
jgi:hypothetical protein